jgi:non-canonical purine NTP pyrophosphatase (RdgB/HAM1 family)
MDKRIIFITENANKFRELQSYFQNYCVSLLSSNVNIRITLEMIKPDIEIQEIQSLNAEEVIMHKLHNALNTCKHLITTDAARPNTEAWIMVEDTSLCISKLGGFPGTFIKFYLQCIPVINIGNDNWGSDAQSIVNLAIGRIALNDNGNTEFNITKNFTGVINGCIVNARGNNGFGYDAIFRPINNIQTNAEMSMEEKAFYNPRTLAFQKVLDYLYS